MRRDLASRGALHLALLLAVLGTSWRPLAAVTCVGRTCGRDNGFPVANCSVRQGGNSRGNQICWSSAFDLACERLGFVVPILCPAGTLGGTSLGGGSSQIATAIGGYNAFTTQVVTPATPRRQAQEQAAAERERQVASGEAGHVHVSEITASYEREQWRLDGDNGHTDGVRTGWRREGETGFLYSAAGSYQRAEPDGGTGLGLVNVNLGAGHTLDRAGIFRATANVTFSHFSGAAEQNLYGGGAVLYANKPFANGTELSGGVVLQLIGGTGLPSNVQSVSYGVAYGVPLGQRLALNLDAFGSHIARPDVPSRDFFLFGGSLSGYLTSHFGVTLGYRALDGIRGLASNTFTLGASSRW